MNVLLTGATGTMGMATLQQLIKHTGKVRLRAFARPNRKNRKKLCKYQSAGLIEIFWGDLCSPDDIRQAVKDIDIILHVGGMVSPKADSSPRLTWRTNVGAMKSIVKAVRQRDDADNVTVVYIGSVSQYGSREYPMHWGRTGDPMLAAVHDVYALSKIAAERILAESGLRRWVSLRLGCILGPELLTKGTDPISFHVPLRGVLEWSTALQNGTLLSNLCTSTLPDSFLRKFYNIGGGESFRLTNYIFEKKLMGALNCPTPEKVFDTRWFATRNFHGIWYTDSDKLDRLIPFRKGIDADEYFRSIARTLPRIFRMAKIVPPALIKAGMKMVAKKKPLGSLSWENGKDPMHTRIFFGSQEKRDAIPDWDEFNKEIPDERPRLLSHGYDESRPISTLSLEDMKSAAEFRGGKCLSEKMTTGDIYTPLQWECARGHHFQSTPCTVLLGGHWCPECFPRPVNAPDGTPAIWNYASEARINPFLAQTWYSTHSPEENDIYEGPSLPTV